MNWSKLFENIEQKLDLFELVDIVNSNGEYKDIYEANPNDNIEIIYLSENIPVGTIYYGGGKDLFKVLFDSDTISIGKARLLNFIDSEILKKELVEESVEKAKFFDYEFMINLHLSADIASGQGYFQKSLSEMLVAIEKGPIYLNSKNKISSIPELNETLKNQIYGFKGSIEAYNSLR